MNTALSVPDAWAAIRDVLGAYAPRTAACLNAPATQQEVEQAESELPFPLPADLKASLLCCNGVAPAPQAGRVIPPMFLPYSISDLVENYHLRMETEEELDDSGSEAGTLGAEFSAHFYPFAHDTTGDEYLIDLRPGRMHGCVREWTGASGAMQPPLWESVGHMLRDVAHALKSAGDSYGATRTGHIATLEDNALRWQYAETQPA